MTGRIDPSAIIENGAVVAPDAWVGPWSLVRSGVRIGAEARLASHVVVGADGFDTRHREVGGSHGVLIGPETIIAEFASIKAGQQGPTRIGLGCRIGSNVSIGHDCVLEDGLTVLPGSVLAGHVTLQAGALVGIGAVVRQGVVIGAHTTVAMGAVVTRSLPPLALHVPGRPLRQNSYNLRDDHPAKDLVGEGPHDALDWSHPILAALMADFQHARTTGPSVI